MTVTLRGGPQDYQKAFGEAEVVGAVENEPESEAGNNTEDDPLDAAQD